jgi:hypothetical protein
MFRCFRDPAFRWTFLGLSFFLLAAGCLAVRITRGQVSRNALVGNWQRGFVWLLPLGNTPGEVQLHTDGTMTLLSAKGDTISHGTWRWDGKERTIRTDDVRWDRRLRVRSTLLGPRLCMRISEVPLQVDDDERYEAVDLVRVAEDPANQGRP